MRWNYIDTGFSPGTFNMEFDESLALGLDEGRGIPSLRVYGWTPHAVSIGFHQSAGDFDRAALERAGIDLVRRPTGGRAILHAGEITYSVVIQIDGCSPRDIYRMISAGLLRALSLLGVEASLSGGDLSPATAPGDPNSIPCFSTSVKYEIQYNGRKLAGSAQRRYNRVVLQHGSLLLDARHRRIVDFLSPQIRHARSVLEEDLESRTIDAETILQRKVSFEEAAGALKKGFELACGITFAEMPSPEQIPSPEETRSSDSPVHAHPNHRQEP